MNQSVFQNPPPSNFAKYILKEGTTIEKRELLANLRSRIMYKDKTLTLINEH